MTQQAEVDTVISESELTDQVYDVIVSVSVICSMLFLMLMGYGVEYNEPLYLAGGLIIAVGTMCASLFAFYVSEFTDNLAMEQSKQGNYVLILAATGLVLAFVDSMFLVSYMDVEGTLLSITVGSVVLEESLHMVIGYLYLISIGAAFSSLAVYWTEFNPKQYVYGIFFGTLFSSFVVYIFTTIP